MGTRGYRHREVAKIVRPAGVALVAIVGIIAIMAIFAIEVALVWLRSQRGLSVIAQGTDLAIGGMSALFLIWIYWGVWDLLPSAWQIHVWLGLPITVGFGYVAWMAPELATIIAHHVKAEELEIAKTVLRIVAIGMAALEIVTFIVMIGTKDAFEIGKPKPLWEKR
jgi:hypothetical protein